MIFQILTLFIGIFLTECRPDESRIVGGYSINITQAPYMVSIESSQQHYCGGSIIGDGKGNGTWILTAAHCADKPDRIPFVRVGSSFKEKGGTVFSVINTIMWTNFTRSTMVNDIALMQLNGTITGSIGGVKIKLPYQDEPIEVGKSVRVSGWGFTQNDKQSREKLRTVELDILDHNECAEKYSDDYNFQVTDNMICAGRPGKDSCNMDSGGPLVYKNQKLIGIVSFGIDCASDTYPGIYTNIAKYVDWINKNAGI